MKKRRRRMHMGSVGFAGLGRAIIKNNSNQMTKHRSKRKIGKVLKTPSLSKSELKLKESKQIFNQSRLTTSRQKKYAQIALISLMIFLLLILMVLLLFN